MLIKDWDRAGLERLLGYCSRPALSQKRLVYAEKADTVLYRTEPKAGKSGAGNDACRIPAALDAAATAAQGYASAVSGAMLIYEKGSQENALPLTAFLCRR